MVWILEDPVSMVENLLTAASVDPISAVLVALGACFVVAASAAFGVPVLGALVDPLTPDNETQRQRR